jgi:predicted nucleotidyltransferase
MAKIATSVSNSIHRYLDLVRKRYPLQAVYLFGSHATGGAHEWSDIDLALVSTAFVKDPTDSSIRLMQLAAEVDWRIEPHVFGPNDFNVNHPLAAEIQRVGVHINDVE